MNYSKNQKKKNLFKLQLTSDLINKIMFLKLNQS